MKRQFPYYVRPPLKPPARHQVATDLNILFELPICNKRYSATMRHRFQRAFREDLHHQYGVDRRPKTITAAISSTLLPTSPGYETRSESATTPCRQQIHNRPYESAATLRLDSSVCSYDSGIGSATASPSLSTLSTSSSSSVQYRMTVREPPPAQMPLAEPRQRILLHGRAAGKLGVTSPLGKLYRKIYGSSSALRNADAVRLHPIVDYTSDDDPGWPHADDEDDDDSYEESDWSSEGDGDDDATPGNRPGKMDSGEWRQEVKNQVSGGEIPQDRMALFHN